MEKTKILIVEDEAIIAMEVENQLQGLGYEVTSIIDTGDNAIKKAEENKPDLILMDILNSRIIVTRPVVKHPI